MAHRRTQQVVGIALGITVVIGGIGCGSGSGKNLVPPPKDIDVAQVKVVPADSDTVETPSLEPSALQRTLAELTPARARAPGPSHKRIDRAVDGYLQRIQTNRIYLALDKPIYQPGETIWFRTWELGSADLMPATRSGQAMTFKLVSPKGTVVLQKRVAIAEGVARNDFMLPASVPGGEYILRVMSDTGATMERKVVVSSYEPPRIKKTLEFVRKAYGPGDTVAAAISLHRATGEALRDATVTAIASVDDIEIARSPISVAANGNALVKFELPARIARGDGLLTVLVEDSGVTEAIQKRIPITLSSLDLGLFPEGGDLVVGLPSRVYFSAKTLIGKAADVRGRVVDDKGEFVTGFASLHNGLGRFEITPRAGRSYRVEITNPIGITKKYRVPTANAAGCSMQIVDDFDSKRDEIRVAVWCSSGRLVVATATLRERKLGTQSVKVRNGSPTVIAIASPRWDQGAVRVTLFSDRGAPLAERLIYRGRRADLKLSVKADRTSYSPRDRVALSIQAMDIAGNPVEADLSMVVVNDTVLSFADDKTANILAAIYLEHELPGQKIEEPNFYFTDDAKAAPGLDLVLGTAGWRRFDWKLILSPDYGAETGGKKWDADHGYHTRLEPTRAPRKRNKTARAVKTRRVLRVLRRDSGSGVATPGTTRAPTTHFAQPANVGSIAGRVADLAGKGIAGVAVNARSVVTNRGARTQTDAAGRYTLRGLQPGMYQVSFSWHGVFLSSRVSVRLGRATPLSRRLDRARARSVSESSADVAPAPATRSRRRTRRRPRRRHGRARRPRPAAARPMAPQPRPRAIRRPANKPVASPPVTGNSATATKIDRDWAAKDLGINGQVWAAVREFPAPNYEKRYDGARTDFRETIHWAPTVRTNAAGKATVAFYLSDSVTSFRAIVEGVSASGRPGRTETVIQSKLPVSLVAKLPLEVSAGDRIQLPVTLANETTRKLTATIHANFGRAFKVIEAAPTRVTLGGGKRKSFFYTLEVVGNGREKSDGRMALSVEAARLKDEVERVVDVVPLGFAQEVSIAGTVEHKAVHNVVLAGALRGSIDATLTMYPSPLATMTKGTEAMVREPHGCFEQASSANYPNVMVLSYLESHDAADPAMVTKTHGMLERGYQKLTGYESKRHGFEWFGGDPGHEALTAYGLMEFSDMSKVYSDTDMAMVRRTASWLKSRRDGKGGYKRNSRALDSFGRASAEVTNGYITWALAQAGETDMAAELGYQRKIAATTKDPYLMALAAGTMAKLDPTSTSTADALSRLVTMSSADGAFKGADHSITRSGGVALDIETTSFAVLALLEAGSENLARARTSIEWLDKHRSGFGGYGSTQSTVLALKAMTAYASATRATRSGGIAQLYVNGVKTQQLAFEAGRKDALVFDDAAQHLRAGKNKIEIRLDSDDPLPYSMAITYRTKLPVSSERAAVAVSSHLASSSVAWGETVKMKVSVRNITDKGVPMTLARIGIPGGLAFQAWQLKELKEKKLVDFYETRDREVILYWRSMRPKSEKQIDLQLMATIPGRFTAPASSAYLYYTDDFKHWAEPVAVKVKRK